jgi:hypothetical protein
MQPCQNCGAVTVNAAGYCTRCGVYRGLPPQSAPPYPQSGVPYSVPPYSVPPTPPRQRSPFFVPLIALSSVLALLIVAIVVVAIARSGGHGDATAGGSPTPSTAIDECLVGTWRTTSDAEQLDVDQVGPVTVTGQGAVVHIHPDGLTYQDYSQSTPYQGSANSHQLSIAIAGTVQLTIKTNAGTMSFHDINATGTVTAKVDGVTITSAPLTLTDDPVQYTCSGNTATEHTSQYNVSLARVSTSP